MHHRDRIQERTTTPSTAPACILAFSSIAHSQQAAPTAYIPPGPHALSVPGSVTCKHPAVTITARTYPRAVTENTDAFGYSISDGRHADEGDGCFYPVDRSCLHICLTAGCSYRIHTSRPAYTVCTWISKHPALTIAARTHRIAVSQNTDASRHSIPDRRHSDEGKWGRREGMAQTREMGAAPPLPIRPLSSSACARTMLATPVAHSAPRLSSTLTPPLCRPRFACTSDPCLSRHLSRLLSSACRCRTVGHHRLNIRFPRL